VEDGSSEECYILLMDGNDDDYDDTQDDCYYDDVGRFCNGLGPRDPSDGFGVDCYDSSGFGHPLGL